MQAWRVHEHGEPADVLRWEEVPVPEPGPGELLVDVEACGLNFPDVLLCRGTYQSKPPLPFTPGVEICGRDPRSGQRYAALATEKHGGFADKALIRAGKAFPIPDDMPARTAAAFAVTYMTGYVGLFRRARLRIGDTLLVHAGAGGVGSAAIQLGLAAGAHVLATAGGPAKVEICKRLGAHVAIDYTAEDFAGAVNDATGGRGVDVVYDSVGGDVFTRSTKCVAFEGRIVVVGFASGDFALARTNHILVKNYSVLGLHWGLYDTFEPSYPPVVFQEVLDLWRDGKVDPLVTEVTDLSGAPAALERLASRRTVGKVIVERATP